MREATSQKKDRHRNAAVSFRPPPDLAGRLRDLAKRERRSVAMLAVVLLEEALGARDAKQGGA